MKELLKKLLPLTRKGFKAPLENCSSVESLRVGIPSQEDCRHELAYRVRKIATAISKSQSLIARELRDALCASSFAQLCNPPCLSMRNNAPVEHCVAEA